MGRRLALSLAMLGTGAALLAAVAGVHAAGVASEIRQGGTFRISFRDIDSVDPARAYTPSSWQLLDAMEARLLRRPDRPAPEGLRLVPELAADFPRVSRDGRRYEFTIRSGLRFSDGRRVTAASFARAINRALSPALESPAAPYLAEVRGAQEVLDGKAAAAAGVVGRGRKLIITLTRPAPDFAQRLSLPFLAAVPPNLPADPEGVRAPLPSPAPYYLAEFVPDRRIVLRRNRYYKGERPQHVASFVADLQAASGSAIVDAIASGRADWGAFGPLTIALRGRELVRKYGVNRSQFYLKAGLQLDGFALNTSRPLFRNNVRLRKAVNFAVERRALLRELRGLQGGRLTDQYLPPGMPGFRNADIYPLRRPKLRKARALARGRTRSGKAVLYTLDGAPSVAQGQIIKRDLARIGIEVEIRAWPFEVYLAKVAKRSEPFDIAWYGWGPDFVDPFAYLSVLFDGRSIRDEAGSNPSYFDSPTYNRLLRRASRLTGKARYRAYGAVDVRLARAAAPFVAYAFINTVTFVSARVGCKVFNPEFDVSAVCLKR